MTTTTVATSTSDLTPAPGLPGYAKAWAGAGVGLAVSIISALLMVLPADGGFGDLTVVQWLGVALAVLTGPAVGGIVGAVPNALKRVTVVDADSDDTVYPDGRHAA